MKSLMLFLQMVFLDLEDWCGTSTTRDFKTVACRVESEGLSFLTITLPNFGSDFQKSLDQGYVSDDLFVGFKRRGGLPQFLGGFLRNIFDSSSGRLLSNPDHSSIIAIRQLTLMFAKIEVPCSPKRLNAAFDRFIECEQELRRLPELDPDIQRSFLRLTSMLFGDIFSRIDRKIYHGGIIPKHGPGKTADRITGNRKWSSHTWTERLEKAFPSWMYLTSSEMNAQDALHDLQLLEPGAEIPVRVVAVPKTLKTPRIIAIEPVHMQYVQQGLLREFSYEIGRDDILRNFIDWSSQDPNKDLARKASGDGTLATLDLKEASDRVSNQHVRLLLSRHPHLFEGVDACRSRKADVNGKTIIRLAKFASMGSALTFPMESIIFFLCVLLGIEKELKRPLSLIDVKSLQGKVRIYGDDIIVPVEYVHSVIGMIESFGIQVNRSKSFWTGKFRESCGGDFYDQTDVSVVRLRTLFPTSRADAREIVSTVSTRNLLYEHGFWRSAKYLDGLLERFIPMPYVLETSPVLGKRSYLGYERPIRIDPNTHNPLVKGYCVSAEPPVSRLDGYDALTKCLTLLHERNTSLPGSGVDHLERTGRPAVVSIKLRWAPPF